jgi:tryptophan 2,3-dioxygenase
LEETRHYMLEHSLLDEERPERTWRKRYPVLKRRVVGNDSGDMITQGVFYIEARDLDKSMK